jgi:hypothetical protein
MTRPHAPCSHGPPSASGEASLYYDAKHDRAWLDLDLDVARQLDAMPGEVVTVWLGDLEIVGVVQRLGGEPRIALIAPEGGLDVGAVAEVRVRRRRRA